MNKWNMLFFSVVVLIALSAMPVAAKKFEVGDGTIKLKVGDIIKEYTEYIKQCSQSEINIVKDDLKNSMRVRRDCRWQYFTERRGSYKFLDWMTECTTEQREKVLEDIEDLNEQIEECSLEYREINQPFADLLEEILDEAFEKFKLKLLQMFW